MSRTMKAAVLRKPNEMVIEEMPLPQPKAGWVRLRNRASGICGSDMHIYTGNHPWLRPGNPMAKFVLGNVYGHEVAGTVDALGPDVEGVKVGDRVALNAIVPCLRCEFCRVGLYQICRNLEHYGFHHPGGFAEYTLVPAANVLPIPESVSFEEAALLDVLVVALHSVQIAGLSIPDRVAILGAGPIGLAMAAVARRAGVRDLFLTAKYDLQKEIARRLGVPHILDSTSDDVPRFIQEHTSGLGVDCVLESIGYKSKTIPLALELVRKGGQIVFTGVFEEPQTLDFGTLLAKEATIRASHAFGVWKLVPELSLALEMIASGEFPARQIITHRFPLDRINEGFRVKLADPGRTLKVQITFED